MKQFEKDTLIVRVGYPEELKAGILSRPCAARMGNGRWYAGQHMLIDGAASSWKHPASFKDTAK